MPKAEIVVWSRLKNSQLGGLKFRRQQSVGAFVLDFYCHSLKLAIEIDGDSHFQDGAQEYDLFRQRIIEQLGISFLRFTNTEVYENLEEVLRKIVEWSPPRPPGAPLLECGGDLDGKIPSACAEA